MSAATPAAPGRPAPVSRRGSRALSGLLVLPATLWYVILLVLPIAIVVIFSFGERTRNGGYQPAFTLDNYAAALGRVDPFMTSLMLASLGTLLCLFVGLPLAYFIATRATRRKALLIVLLVIPFWTSFLIRTYAWLLILGVDGIAGFVQDVTGNGAFRILGTEPGVLLGLVYGYLPLMVFPLYVTLERMDRSQVFTIGNALFLRFLEARNWPAGSALSVGLILIMLVVVTAYVWFTNRGRKTRDVSVL
jgi:spermidine/putrescine transport system permease protein